MSNSNVPRRRWFWRLSALAGLLAILITGVLLTQLNSGALGLVDVALANALPMMSGVRLALFGLLYLAGPSVLTSLSKRRYIHAGKARRVIDARHRLLLLFLSLELLVGLKALDRLQDLGRWLLA